MLQSAQLVEDTSQRPDITLVVVGFFFAKLGRKVVGCTDYSVRKVGCLVEHLSHAQVAYLNLILLRQKHVDGLDVSVEDLVAVQVVHAQAHFNKELPDLALTQLPPHLPLEVNPQISVLAILHYDIDLGPIGERVVELHNVRAVDFR